MVGWSFFEKIRVRNAHRRYLARHLLSSNLLVVSVCQRARSCPLAAETQDALCVCSVMVVVGFLCFRWWSGVFRLDVFSGCSVFQLMPVSFYIRVQPIIISNTCKVIFLFGFVKYTAGMKNSAVTHFKKEFQYNCSSVSVFSKSNHRTSWQDNIPKN